MENKFEVMTEHRYRLIDNVELSKINEGVVDMSSSKIFQKGDVVTVLFQTYVKGMERSGGGYVVRDETYNTGDYFLAWSLETALEEA